MTLAELILARREELLGLWRTEVRQLPSAAQLDTPTLTDMMPEVLNALADTLRRRAELPSLGPYASRAVETHGVERVQEGFAMEEVVAEYATMQDLILDLAARDRVDVNGKPIKILTRFFARAVTAAARVYQDRAVRAIQTNNT